MSWEARPHKVLCELMAEQAWEAKVFPPVPCPFLVHVAVEPRVSRWPWGKLAEALEWGEFLLQLIPWTDS